MLSVTLATHNEAKNLEACLNSLKKFTDEIILVDGDSTDETIAIAKKFGAKITKTTNKKNFHINKQMANDLAKGDLVLSMDADELIDEELAKFIVELHKEILTKKYKSKAVAWNLKRKNFFMGRWLSKGGQYPDMNIRLFLRGKARWPQVDVHEKMEVDGNIAVAPGHLLHYSNPTFADYMVKFNRYTSFKASQLNEANVKIGIGSGFKFLILKPITTFLSLYVRHKGFVDGVPGFVFALMSGLHHFVSYLKLWDMKHD